MRATAHRIATASPSDVSGVAALLDSGALAANEVVAVLGKTEGNGGRNDFTRELCTRSIVQLLAARLGASEAELCERVVVSISGGCEGVASPHLVVFGRSGPVIEGGAVAASAPKRLAIAVGSTRPFAPDEIGRRAQVEETARAVRRIAAAAGLDDLADVHLVQMKGAIPAAGGAADPRSQRVPPSADPRSQRVPPSADPRSRCDMVHSRAASALGAAVALGEVDPSVIDDDSIGARLDLFSSVASVSAKPGLERTELMVLGMSRSWEGDLGVAHGVMRDLLDVDAIKGVLHRLGIDFEWRPTPEQTARVLGVFAKSEADPRGSVRGRRHVMLDDDDVSDTRWSRCALGAVLASVVGDTAVYVSTRAEHMGPPGGGPVAIVARLDST